MEKFVIMLRSAASPKAGEIIRDLVHQDVLGPLSELIAGDEADLRANMLLAILMGSGVLRTVMKVDAFDGSETQRIACGERFRCLFEAALSCRSEEHTSELQSLMRISYAVFCLKKKQNQHNKQTR